jgi:hypothetical protein
MKDVASLRGVDGLGLAWLYCDHDHRNLIWDTHCSSPHTRWILRHHGTTAPHSLDPRLRALLTRCRRRAIRDEMRAAVPELLPGFVHLGS